MIEGGLEYGLLTTGEATVFLKVDWAEPETLYYHLAEPGPEVLAHPEHMQSSSAVGQYLAFSLMALGRPGGRVEHGQDERDRATANLNSWAPTTYEDFDRSPITRQGRRHRRGRIGDERNTIATRRDQSESSDDESGYRPPDTPSPSERSQRILARRPRQGTDEEVERRYCTQACLLDWFRRHLDPCCPNAGVMADLEARYIRSVILHGCNF
ncbi:uncharacterized protein HRG_11975 [Hirsutella rhossiliensis]|uniref:Uncharacterized protein n=1 Tax=Hirsutella rhossiliensis TaxID=111463 RepID=A0A9P8MIE8_9HYPO|nr:uncharacterized protein HRG_11975 [Hirsutella rhossiliensis]KAH0956968.1 hypothetical protein HRG_11975 [Hirsutella rhossiliensis]